MPINLFPKYAVDQGAVTAQRQKAASVVQKLVQGVNTVSGLIYRQLRPSDFSLNGATVTGHLVNPSALVENTYLNDVFPSFTTKTSQAFALTGIALNNATPLLDEITVYVGAEPIAILPLQEIKSPGAGTQPQVGYFFDPIWVPPQTHCRIDLLSGTAQTQSLEAFTIFGFVGELAGTNVNQQRNNPAATA